MGITIDLVTYILQPKPVLRLWRMTLTPEYCTTGITTRSLRRRHPYCTLGHIIVDIYIVSMLSILSEWLFLRQRLQINRGGINLDSDGKCYCWCIDHVTHTGIIGIGCRKLSSTTSGGITCQTCRMFTFWYCSDRCNVNVDDSKLSFSYEFLLNSNSHTIFRESLTHECRIVLLLERSLSFNNNQLNRLR